MAQSFDYGAAMDDLDERIAILRRYRKMLDLQRDKLEAYLAVVEHRDLAFSEGNLDGFEDYALEEQNAVRSILTVQRCLDPLKQLYLQLHPEGSGEIRDLELRLERLRVEVLKRNEQSREVLKVRAAELKGELRKLKSHAVPSSVYAGVEARVLLDLHA